MAAPADPQGRQALFNLQFQMEAKAAGCLALPPLGKAGVGHHLQHPGADAAGPGVLDPHLLAIEAESAGVELALLPQAPQQRLDRMAGGAALQLARPWGGVEQHRRGRAQLPKARDGGGLQLRQPQGHLHPSAAIEPPQRLQRCGFRIAEGLGAHHLQGRNRPIAL